jgi:hypothetical protein
MFNWDMLVPLAGMATGLILLLPIMRAGVKYLERRGSVSETEDVATLREELRTLSDRLDAIEADGSRLPELEERVDFAERMLAQQREAPRLEGVD